MPAGRCCGGLTGAGSADGDRSFPRNHTATAAAAAVALAVARSPGRARAWLTVPPALLTAFSRVSARVRLPHDAAVGLLVGGSAAALVNVLLSRPAWSLALTARNNRVPLAVRIPGPGAGGRVRAGSC
ncbi:phosphatase PAP2 family protein [Streptomyces sp. NPDC056192]|uniref:phosphatase PAP2 family protein n=1 Tax=Streptomyces sp. NPDC056192 TaxID=3345743 RepID=UPI0035E32056